MNNHRDEYPDFSQIIRLLSVPEIENGLFSAVKHYETGEFGNKTEKFDECMASLKESVYYSILKKEEPPIEEENEAPGNPLYWFELVQYRRGYWFISKLEPNPAPLYDKNEILPADVIARLETYPVNLVEIIRPGPIYSEIMGQSYDVDFSRLSHYYICGEGEYRNPCRTSPEPGLFA